MIKKFKKFYLKIMVKNKFFIKLLIVMLSIELVVVCLINYKMFKDTEDRYINIVNQQNEQLDNNLNALIEDIDRVSFLHIMDREIDNILNKNYKQNSYEYILDKRTIDNAIFHSLRLNTNIWGITIVGKNGTRYSNTSADENYTNDTKKWLEKALSSPNKRFVTPSYTANFSGSKSEFISIVHVMKDIGKDDFLGYVRLDMSFKAIKNLITENPYTKKEIGSVIIGSQGIMFHEQTVNIPDGNFQGKLSDYYNNGGELGKRILNFNGNKYIVCAAKNKSTDWILVNYVPLNTIQGTLTHSIGIYLTALFFIILASIFLTYLYSVRNAGPIDNLIESMSNSDAGKLIMVEESNIKNEELKKIINNYNLMVNRLNVSIDKEYKFKINQKKMQLKMLQAQINPHFLYNTLNLISSLSILEGTESVAEISSKLSLLLRYSLNSPDIVKLHEELSQVENYIYILKIRFPEKINFKIYIDDDVSNFYIPKFIIQPIVENAVKHGLEPRGQMGTIRIEVRRAENLTISVEDDGAGIPEDKLNYINKCLACESDYKPDSKIGINNVNFRIKEYYGKEYGINILSSEGNGTKVTIVLPIIKESEAEV